MKVRFAVSRCCCDTTPPPIVVETDFHGNFALSDGQKNAVLGVAFVDIEQGDPVFGIADRIPSPLSERVRFSGYLGFSGVGVANSAAISSAILEWKTADPFAVYTKGPGAGSPGNFARALVSGGISNDPADFAAFNAIIRTAATISWNVEYGDHSAFVQSLDVTNVAQEIINMPAWASGSSMIFLFDENASDGAVGFGPFGGDPAGYFAALPSISTGPPTFVYRLTITFP